MEKLIKIVQQYPILYDTNHKSYTKTKLKEEIWNSIAEKLNLTSKFLFSRSLYTQESLHAVHLNVMEWFELFLYILMEYVRNSRVQLHESETDSIDDQLVIRWQFSTWKLNLIPEN